MRRVALVAFVSVALLAVAGCCPEEAESSPDIVESRGAVGVPGAINGVVIGQSARMMILSCDATISYVVTRDGSWIQTEGGEWEEVDTVGPIERPLDDLASPTSITILSSDNDGTSAVAVYDGAAFDSDDVIEMRVSH